MKFSKLILVCIVILGIIGLSLILFKVVITHKQTPSTDQLQHITIGRVIGYPDLALIAQKNGYFKENGLDVTFKSYDSPNPIMKDILASKINMVSATAEFLVVSHSFKGENLKIVSVVSTQKRAWELIARKDKNIQNLSDLLGKRIGVQYNTIGGFLLGRFLSYYELDINKVEIDDLPRAEYTKNLSQGNLDAVVTTSPFTNRIKKMLGSNAIAWSAQPERSIYSVSFTTSDFIKKNPKIVIKYLRALVEAEQFVKSHNTQARAIMQQQLHLSTSDMNDLWQKFDFNIELPQELFITMEDEARWIIENQQNNSAKIPNYLDSIYFEGLEIVKPEAITAYH